MKQLLYTFAVVAMLVAASSLDCHAATEEASMKENAGKNAAKMDWWLDDKFGMFIHWGPSSVAGVEIGWARETHPFDHPGKGELVPDAVYDALYKEFNPVEFDADALVQDPPHWPLM